jgi:hypothetical protein
VGIIQQSLKSSDGELSYPHGVSNEKRAARSGRRPGQTRTRVAILEAARSQFGSKGFRSHLTARTLRVRTDARSFSLRCAATSVGKNRCFPLSGATRDR